MVHLLRKRWRIPTVKINGTAANPLRWPDGSYSVQGAAAAIGITPQVIFDWLRRGWLTGKQIAKGSLGKSRCLQSRLSNSEQKSDVPPDPREGHHESVESGNPLFQSPNDWLAVISMERRS
jgi:hypothetical protein